MARRAAIDIPSRSGASSASGGAKLMGTFHGVAPLSRSALDRRARRAATKDERAQAKGTRRAAWVVRLRGALQPTGTLPCAFAALSWLRAQAGSSP